MFGKKEVNELLISSVILGFVFGFDDGREVFSLSYWLFNFVLITIITGLSIFGREFVKKVVAKRKNCVTEYEIWKIKRFWFQKSSVSKRGIPIFSLLAVLFSFLSRGKLFFCAIGKTTVESVAKYRVGRKFSGVTDYERGVILLSGIIFNLLLALIFNMTSIYPFRLFFIVNIWLVAFNMIPIPSLDGGMIFFSSKLLYVFSFGFIILSFGLKDLNIITNIILSFIVAFILLVLFYYFGEYKK